MARRLLVLGWHNIEPTWSFPGSSPSAGLRGLDRQLRTLRRYTRVLPLRSALADLAAGRPLPRRAVALTFDDGYRDNATLAGPLLRRHELPATFFLVTGFLSGTRRAWWEDLGWAFACATAPALRWDGRSFDTTTPQARSAAFGSVAPDLKRFDHRDREASVEELLLALAPIGSPARIHDQFMDWDAARGLLREGHDVGSHTCSHPILRWETEREQAAELVESRQLLESQLQRRVDLVAFPNGRKGDYDETTLRLAREAGYGHALTTRAGFVGSGPVTFELARLVLEPETDLGALFTEAARAGKRAVRRRGALFG